MTEKQYKMRQFIRDCIVNCGYSPTFAEIAEHFSISTAAVSNTLKSIESRQGIVKRRRRRGIILINRDGSVYTPAEDKNLDMQIPGELTIPLRLPDFFRKISADHMLFKLEDDYMANTGLRAGDLLEFAPCPEPQMQNGSLICLKYGHRFFIRIFSKDTVKKEIRHIFPEYLIYDGTSKYCTILGVLRRDIRLFSRF